MDPRREVVFLLRTKFLNNTLRTATKDKDGYGSFGQEVGSCREQNIH